MLKKSNYFVNTFERDILYGLCAPNRKHWYGDKNYRDRIYYNLI